MDQYPCHRLYQRTFPPRQQNPKSPHKFYFLYFWGLHASRRLHCNCSHRIRVCNITYGFWPSKHSQNVIICLELLKLILIITAGGKARQFCRQNALRMPKNNLKLSLIKTAGGKARQVLAIRNISEFQKMPFKVYLMEAARGKVRRFFILTNKTESEWPTMQSSCACWQPPVAKQPNDSWQSMKQNINETKYQILSQFYNIVIK